MAKPLISVSDLDVSLSHRRVITGANLEVHPGEFIGLLGPNGAGKTTLMRAILGLIPCSGTRNIGGIVGYVPQRHEVEWHFPINVYRTVLSGRTGIIGWLKRPRAADHAAAAEALRLVNMEDFSTRPIEELSGGQRQRVLIARALATQPDVLLLDEPFTGLDAPNTESLLELFEDLSHRGKSIIMSTHNLSEAAHACHRLVLFNGTVVADDFATSLLHQTKPWTQTFGVRAGSPLLSAIGVSA
ncbi:anchored repeat-type ABC transporter ATP-binding subunit [Corynebacterium sp. c8Ua_181]|uniref:Anchored repeat-type ABC transporter ATP-binding subunit n=1 Tax=Corynebacterium curieae TaxID=2913500 RepID=A0A9X3RWB0_9CORY|nr:anchored repeat-type ABC transporter ATP-binding subunit [Corynebacterium curieae]MCZ9307938.1 anchored repeat-type ABC transporter ATP-binding subunit [Corynebacterium curieae]MDV2424814.1 anchored repeat-type ABC transporter ATP-binding subunit [Corynebacterium curieae]